ncbi:B-cell receptor CD22-like isoform X1 [Oncorhynchus nerka]|uniref:B-cell receptor CD22-like isoform X1 n=1 Tax=Oncorhynchus nerka TaxID=8023 RepID=UPI0031B7F27A
MALRTAGSVLVVFFWSVTVLLGQDGWSVTYTTQSICVLKGSTVELTCSYTYPSGYTVTTTFWFTKKYAVSLSNDPDYKGRVTYRSDKMNGHTLTITDLRESDSATYMFRFTDQTGKWRYFGKPGVTLSVTGLQVKVTGKTLTCSTTCTLTDNPTYIWYKNGHKVKEDTSILDSDSFSDADSYSCAVKGHEDLLSPAECQKCWSVTYTHQSICALKGSTVDISCSYTYPSYHEIKQAFWFTKWSGMDAEDLSSVPGYEGHIEYLGDKESDCTLRITDLRLSDSAGYRFRFITSGDKFSGSPVSLTVSDLQVKMTTSLFSRWVTLNCGTCTLTDNPTYIWYKNGHKVKEDTSRLYSDYISDADSYSCAVKGHEGLHSPEETLTVRYGQSNTSVSVSPSGEIVEGSSVTLTCSIDANPPVDKYTWYKVTYKNMSMRHSGQSYTIHNISSEDRGEYYCEAENEVGAKISKLVPVNVLYKPRNTSVSVSPSGEIVGSSVTLTCSSDANPPVDKYTWYKRNVTSPKASGQSYTIHNIISEDREGYYCEALNIIGRETIPVHINVTYPAAVFSWVPVMGVGAVLTAGALLLTIYCYMKRRSTGGSDATADTLSFHPDPNSETYTALNMKTRSPEYDTLANVRDSPVTQPLK